MTTVNAISVAASMTIHTPANPVGLWSAMTALITTLDCVQIVKMKKMGVRTASDSMMVVMITPVRVLMPTN